MKSCPTCGRPIGFTAYESAKRDTYRLECRDRICAAIADQAALVAAWDKLHGPHITRQEGV